MNIAQYIGDCHLFQSGAQEVLETQLGDEESFRVYNNNPKRVDEILNELAHDAADLKDFVSPDLLEKMFPGIDWPEGFDAQEQVILPMGFTVKDVLESTVTIRPAKGAMQSSINLFCESILSYIDDSASKYKKFVRFLVHRYNEKKGYNHFIIVDVIGTQVLDDSFNGKDIYVFSSRSTNNQSVILVVPETDDVFTIVNFGQEVVNWCNFSHKEECFKSASEMCFEYTGVTCLGIPLNFASLKVEKLTKLFFEMMEQWEDYNEEDEDSIPDEFEGYLEDNSHWRKE
jgi:hypothetical protein